MAIIAASILDADFSNLRGEIEEVDRAGVDAFTLDVVDGQGRQLRFGPPARRLPDFRLGSQAPPA